jgi:hypothetical protein
MPVGRRALSHYDSTSDRTLRARRFQVPATKKKVAKKTAAKAVAKKPATKKPSARKAAVSPPTAKRAHAKRIKERLHTAIHRAPQTVSTREFEEVTTSVLVMVVELAAETAEVFAEILARIDRIEARLGR